MKVKECCNCGVFAEAIGTLCEFCDHDAKHHKYGSACSCPKELVFGPELMEALRR